MNRRGFLATLFGGAVAAATLDPEQLLWKPGKLISIPRVLHVPRLLQFGVDMDICLEEVAAYTVDQWQCHYESHYLEPAIKKIWTMIGEEAKIAGRPPRFVTLEVPTGSVLATSGPLGTLPQARRMREVDIERRIHVERVDCLIRI